MRLCVTAGLLLALCPAAPAAERFSTGPARAVLIELYTSEGCSSCPPADRWLNELRVKPGLWTEFVPVEFHVTYWDSLGWKDRLSTSAFTAREYAYALAWGGSNVYTPCFVRNGVEWKPGWGTPGGPSALTGVLVLDIGDDGACHIAFTPGPGAQAAPEGHAIHLAVLGGGISSRVTDGENKGRTLGHEFVVLGMTERGLSRNAGMREETASLPLPESLAADTLRRAAAAWVTRQGDLVPIQATGGWLPQATPAD
jgi:hypothetical protein